MFCFTLWTFTVQTKFTVSNFRKNCDFIKLFSLQFRNHFEIKNNFVQSESVINKFISSFQFLPLY